MLTSATVATSYCNNCGIQGHQYHQCKSPIMSIGIITYRLKPESCQPEYLMIRRKDTLGFIDFLRGKYSVYNRGYILNMFKQMTVQEKERIRTLDFEVLWKQLWGSSKLYKQYRSEEFVSRDKFNALRSGIFLNQPYNLTDIIDESNTIYQFDEPEWGFPKGRRNYQEKDYACAYREFSEETGFLVSHLYQIKNLLPFEEIFTGSNYKSYSHKYYLTFMRYEDSLDVSRFDRGEVSKMEWKTVDQCLESVRPYNLEKKRLITNINETITNHLII
jgi:8-oxo-dGTP pyrophosphatase MutT (NUDIX family)